MKNKILLSMLLIPLLLSGCGSESEESYNEAIQNGLDVLATEDYGKAEIYFELAMEEKPGDNKAQTLLLQTINYEDALHFFEEKNYEEAMKKSEEIINTEGGSAALIAKAETLIEGIQQQEEADEGESTVMDDNTNNQEENTGYTYEDFKGIYALFEAAPYESSIQYVAAFMDDHYIDGFRESSYAISDILNKSVENNILKIDYFTPELGGDGVGSSGHLELEIVEENGQKSLFFTDSELTAYPISEQDLLDEAWSLPTELEDDQVKKEQLQQEEPVEELTSSADIIEAYNGLDLSLKVLLAATTVDERAMSPELLGFNVYYNFDGDILLVNVHSGAGVGHPWYTIKYDRETITPVQGVVFTGASGYEDASVNTTPISKIDLYNRYMESKESYDIAIENVIEEPGMSVSQYEGMRSEISY